MGQQDQNQQRQPQSQQKPAAGALTEARVLSDSHLGKINDVVKLTAAEIEETKNPNSILFGSVDTHPEAVKYAKSLRSTPQQARVPPSQTAQTVNTDDE